MVKIDIRLRKLLVVLRVRENLICFCTNEKNAWKVQSVCVQSKPLGDITCALTVILSANQRQILARRTEVGGQYCLRHIGPEVHLNTNKQSPGYTLCTGHSPAPGAVPRGVCRPGPCRWPRRRSPASGPRPGERRSSRQLDCKLNTTMNNCYTSFLLFYPLEREIRLYLAVFLTSS